MESEKEEMIGNRDEWLGYCAQLRGIAAEQAVPYGESVTGKIEDLERAIRNYQFRVYLVGPFSCGKSTLLNNWLGANLLPKGIAPETAVATELHFSEEERTVLYPCGDDGELGTPSVLPGIGPEQMRKVTEMANRGELARACLFVRNSRLREYSDVCLVDLPGLSSACKAHELAINQFVMEKSVGIFCVPMPAGTIQQDALEFLQDMERYRASFNLLLTKADECPPSTHEAIVKQVSETIKNRLGIPDGEFRVGVVSKNDVSAFAAQLDFLKAQRASIFADRFRSEMLAVCADMLTPLKMALSEDFSNERIEESIANLQSAASRLVEIFNETTARIAESVPRAVGRVVEKVKDTLNEKAAGWFLAMKRGRTCDADIAAATKRAVLYHVQAELGEICDRWAEKVSREFGKCIVCSVVGAKVDIQKIMIAGISNEAKSGVKKGVFARMVGGAKAGAKVGKKIGRLIPKIGAPIGKVVGAIVGAICGLLGGADDEARLNERLRGELVSQLDAAGESCRPHIAELFDDGIEDFTSKLKAALEEKVTTLKSQMEGLRAEAEQNREAFAAKKAARLASANVLADIVRKVEVD